MTKKQKETIQYNTMKQQETVWYNTVFSPGDFVWRNAVDPVYNTSRESILPALWRYVNLTLENDPILGDDAMISIRIAVTGSVLDYFKQNR
jgi:hypothetical protein